MGRALRIMNALIRALERAGFAVEVSATLDSEGRASGYKTEAVIHDERIPFSMAEATQRVERPPTDEERAEMRRNPWKRGPFYAYRSTGELSLQIEGGWYRRAPPAHVVRQQASSARGLSLLGCPRPAALSRRAAGAAGRK